MNEKLYCEKSKWERLLSFILKRIPIIKSEENENEEEQ